MIRIAAVYPREAGKKFDLEYYVKTHLPMVREKFGPFGLKKTEVDKAIEGLGGVTPPFFAIGYLYFDTLSDFHKGFAAIGAEIIANISMYTDVTPMIQISEVAER